MKRPIVEIRSGKVHCSHVKYECLLEQLGKQSTVSVTGWHNGEGFDVQLNRPDSATVQLELTWDDWTAIKAAADSVCSGKTIG